jgi:hypothetical protein
MKRRPVRMGNSPTHRNLFRRTIIILGSLAAALGGLATVIANLSSIKEAADKMLASPATKVSLIQTRLIFGSSDIPIPEDVSGITFSQTMPEIEEAISKGNTVIDLGAVSEGDRLNHTKFAELPNLVSLVIQDRLTRGAERYVLIDSQKLATVTLGYLRVLIQKETVPPIYNCRIRVYYPGGGSTDTYSSIDLPEGTWKGYFEFGLMLDKDLEKKRSVTSKWEAVLTCEHKGKAAGDGPVPLTVGQ